MGKAFDLLLPTVEYLLGDRCVTPLYFLIFRELCGTDIHNFVCSAFLMTKFSVEFYFNRTRVRRN